MLELLWSPGYVTSFVLVLTQNSQDLLKSASSRDPKAYEARGGPKDSVSSTWSLRCLLMPKSSQLVVLLLHIKQDGFWCGSQPWIKLFSWHRASRILLMLKRRPVLYLSIWQWHMTLSGTVALLVSCWGFYWISTWSEYYRACPKLKFYWWEQAKQAMPLKKQCSSGISHSSSPFQHLDIQPAFHSFL